MRDAESLVQVQVRYVRPELSRLGHADEGVEVGAVEVDLPAELVHDGADVDDAVLEHAVRRRIGDHQRRQPVGVVVRLCLEVVEVDVAVLVALDDDDPQARHRGAGRVRPVCRCRDQADVPLPCPPALVVLANRQQTRELTL